MITITVGTESRRFEDFTEQWITQQIQRRREDGAASCVTVTIDQPPLNLVLRTPGCNSFGNGSGPGRAPSPQEKQVFDLWDRLGLNDVRFSGGNVIAFLKQLRRGT
jgi:hypothetical protein